MRENTINIYSVQTPAQGKARTYWRTGTNKNKEQEGRSRIKASRSLPVGRPPVKTRSSRQTDERVTPINVHLSTYTVEYIYIYIYISGLK